MNVNPQRSKYGKGKEGWRSWDKPDVRKTKTGGNVSGLTENENLEIVFNRVFMKLHEEGRVAGQ